jgi:hypothetical protein
VVTFLMGSSEWPFVSASCCVWLGRSNRRDLLRILAAQKLWHMSEAHLLELSEKGFWRRTAVQFTTLRIRHALAVPMNATPIFEGKATVVPPPEPPWLIEPEEQTGMMVPVAEVTMFERHMTEPEHEVAIAELEHQTALAEVPEVSRLEPWDMSELG